MTLNRIGAGRPNMFITINTNSGVPVYRQLLEQIRFHIASGALSPGDELPSTRGLSAELGLNPMTVSKVYGLLEEEGLVKHRPGLPLVVQDIGTGRSRDNRLHQLRQDMDELVTKVRQLEVPVEDAVVMFRSLLEAEGDTKRSKGRA